MLSNQSIVICVIFLSLLGLNQASQGKLTCQTRYNISSDLFNDNDDVFLKLNVPDLDWFALNSASLVTIVNTRTKQNFSYNIAKLSQSNQKSLIPFRVSNTIYYPQSDILIVGGNGLLAILNATKNKNAEPKIVSIIQPQITSSNLSLKRFSKDAFVCLFVDSLNFGQSGRLITYSLTNFQIIDETQLSNQPKEIAVLNETHMINVVNNGSILQTVSLPNLKIENQVSLDCHYKASNYVYQNNATSTYVGCSYFLSLQNITTDGDYGILIRADSFLSTLNQNDAFMTFEKVHETQTEWSLTIEQINIFQEPNQNIEFTLGFTSQRVFRFPLTKEQSSNFDQRFVVSSQPFRTIDFVHRAFQVVYGNKGYYQVIDCIYSDI